LRPAGGRGGGFKWPTLEELHQKLFSEDFPDAHNAAADVVATARCFLEMIRLQIIPASKLDIDEAQVADFIERHPDPVQAEKVAVRDYRGSAVDQMNPPLWFPLPSGREGDRGEFARG